MNRDSGHWPGTHIRNSSFTGVVPYQTRSRPHGSNAGNVDDTATTSLLQSGYGGRNAQIDTLDIDGKDSIELVLGHVQRWLVLVARPCIVDENVQAAELGYCRIDDLGPVFRRGDVGSQGGDVCGGC